MMEGLQKAFKGAISLPAQNPKLPPSAALDPPPPPPAADPSTLWLTRPPRGAVSLWTCSKLCAFCFVAGVIVGYTLKRRVRRWAAKFLRRLKDD